MALWMALPVARSHTTVVSLWLVMPIAAMSAIVSPADATASRAVAIWDDRISSGSCSTQPGCGKCCVNSCWAMASTRPAASKTRLRLLVVPWSSARMYRSFMVSI